MDLLVSDSSKNYLLGRGYTELLIGSEGIQSIAPGSHFVDQIDKPITTSIELILFTCRSMGGEIAGLHTASASKDVKEYRYFPTENKSHLPILYAAESDFDLLFESETVILTEGVFDRIAVKRALPDMAVFARLSKGTSGYLSLLLERYSKRVILIFDQDDAGRIGTEKASQRIKGGLDIYRIDIPYKDPSNMLQEKGLPYTKKLLSDRIDTLVL